MRWLTPHYLKATAAIFAVDVLLMALAALIGQPNVLFVLIMTILNFPALPIIFFCAMCLFNVDPSEISRVYTVAMDATIALISSLAWAFLFRGFFRGRPK
jgi:hypothetical protein